MTLKRALPLFAGLALILAAHQPAYAQYATPGAACTTNGVLANSNGFLTCTGGYWTVNPIIAASVSVGTNTPLVSVDLSYKTDALALPVGTTGARPTGGTLVNGEIRYNSTLGAVEAYVNGAWATLLAGSGSGTAAPAAGSEGYVQFNSSGNLNADSGLVWDNTNKRLGLGTATPSTLLDLGAFTGTASNTLHVASATGYDSTLKLMETSDNYGFTIKNSNGSTGLTGLNILRHSNSAAGASALFVARDTGYVGVGTTVPVQGSQLSVYNGSSGGTSADNAGLLVQSLNRNAFINLDSKSANAGAIVWSSAFSETGRIDYYNSTNKMIFYTNNAGAAAANPRMVIDSSGRVGVGTTAPANLIGTYSAAQYQGFQLNNASNTVAQLIGLETNNDNGAVALWYSGAKNVQIAANGISFINGGNVGIGTTAPANRLDVYGGTVIGTSYTGITGPTNGLAVQGSVGIGTTNTSVKLEISGTGDVDDDVWIKSYSSATRNGGMLAFYKAGGTAASPTTTVANDNLGAVSFRGTDGTTTYIAAQIASFAETAFSTAASANLRFSTMSAGVSSERMRIDSSGNVGIGSTTPVAKLDVNGTIRPVGATAGAACTPIGIQAYNSSTGEPMYCDGSVWKVAGGSGSGGGSNGISASSTLTVADVSSLGTDGACTALTVTNSGASALTGLASSFVGGSTTYLATCTYGTNPCGGTLAAGANCNMGARLLATAPVGPSFAILQVSATGVSSPTTVIVTGKNTRSCSLIGEVCADGTVYAGLTPDGSVPMYVMPCDLGMSGPKGNCAGSRSYYTWNNGSSNWSSTGYTSQVTGKGNTAGLVALGTSSPGPYAAARACASQTYGGHNDWYLPALSELTVIYNNVDLIGGITTNTSYYYWSSSESSNTNSYQMTIINGGSTNYNRKNVAYFVRCARR